MCQSAKIVSINRHRLAIDGDGVTTLVAFHGCPLRCRYCLNPRCIGDGSQFKEYSPIELFGITCIDELYFIASGGGITFGGGEPGLRSKFIQEFREICGDEWKINIETSLNVPEENIEQLLAVADTFFIDIKDMNQAVYKAYTGKDNDLVMTNLALIARKGLTDRCVIRLPLIAGYNTDDHRDTSRMQLEAMGFNRFDPFEYTIR